MAFGAALPKIRERVNQDLSLHGLPQRKVVAAIVQEDFTAKDFRTWLVQSYMGAKDKRAKAGSATAAPVS